MRNLIYFYKIHIVEILNNLKHFESLQKEKNIENFQKNFQIFIDDFTKIISNCYSLLKSRLFFIFDKISYILQIKMKNEKIELNYCILGIKNFNESSKKIDLFINLSEILVFLFL